MLVTEHASRLLASLTIIGAAAEDATAAIDAVCAHEAGSEARRWMRAIKEALARIQLDCADARYAAGALREALPSPESLQPRLL